MKIKITHVITSLDKGGAESMLFKLLKHINREKYTIEVICLSKRGEYANKIEELGIPVFSIGLSSNVKNIKKLIKAYKLTSDSDIIQSWMYHADFFGFIFAKVFRRKKLIWGIRHDDLSIKNNKLSTLFIAKVNARLSKRVDKIITCSKNAITQHVKFGYNQNKFTFIPNGFELNSIPMINNENLDENIRNNVNNGGNYVFIHIGRWHKIKDYNNLIKSISLVKNQYSNFSLLMVGKNIDNDNNELISLLEKYRVKSFVKLLGKRDDVQELLMTSDLLISSSSGEGFPNVVGESMALGVPCIVTNVGESAYLVNNPEYVVPKKDSNNLSKAIIKFIQKSQNERIFDGIKAQERIFENFDIKKVALMFEECYKINS